MPSPVLSNRWRSPARCETARPTPECTGLRPSDRGVPGRCRRAQRLHRVRHTHHRGRNIGLSGDRETPTLSRFGQQNPPDPETGRNTGLKEMAFNRIDTFCLGTDLLLRKCRRAGLAFRPFRKRLLQPLHGKTSNLPPFRTDQDHDRPRLLREQLQIPKRFSLWFYQDLSLGKFCPVHLDYERSRLEIDAPRSWREIPFWGR